MVKNPNSKLKTYKNTNNPLEALQDLDSSFDSDSFFGKEEFNDFSKKVEEAGKAKKKQEFKVFDYQQYNETVLIKKQISELTDLVRKEIASLKRENAALMQEASDIEKLTINSLPEKPGIYHVRFLEVVLSILRHIRAKVGESKTWMEAMVTRRKKRGSLFAARSKKQGTQYSMSQELQNARSVQ